MVTFTEKQEDVLKELINISFGDAASVIGDILRSYAHLNVPKIVVTEVDNLQEIIDERIDTSNDYYVTKQVFRNSFDGENIFVLTHEDAEKLTKMLYWKKTEFSKTHIKSAVLELTNIITSASIGRLSEMMKTNTYFEAPSIEEVYDKSSIEYNNGVKYDNVIILETLLDLKDENIKGLMFILVKENAIEWLMNALNRFLK
jgi:chemotaxis protein CheC